MPTSVMDGVLPGAAFTYFNEHADGWGFMEEATSDLSQNRKMPLGMRH